ncbi:MAG: PEP-CTERM sorting domain-containing protein [Planctomycetota bacterium]|nr:PEP-CTERM sorting domain-containing protein [Planctomycetota bacterium]
MSVRQIGVCTFLLGIAGILNSGTTTAGTVVSVSGKANPFLAGLPNGSTATHGDRAPQESPTEVVGLSLTPGDVLHFAATGSVSYNSGNFNGPDGGVVFSRGAENGIAGYTITVNALLGVFLGPDRPDLSAAPVALDFGTTTAREFLTLSPMLKQTFFIGDGTTSTNAIQEFVVPSGATRLFLGMADGVEWNNNSGSFSVNVTETAGSGGGPAPVPEPGSLVLVIVGAVGCIAFCSIRRQGQRRHIAEIPQ